MHLAPCLIYLALSLLYWRKPPSPHSSLLTAARGLLLGALLLHGASLLSDLFGAGGLRFGLSSALSLTIWFALSLYLAESFFTRLDGVLKIALPIAAAFTLLPLLHPDIHQAGTPDRWAFRAHFLVAMLAYGVFTLAALHALMMGLAEKRLHHAQLDPAGAPPLLTQERLLFRLIAIAFGLLTLTIASGVFFSEQLFGTPFTFSHKLIFTVIAWLVFGTLLFGRRQWGWRGSTARRWALVGFASLVLAYLGTRFVLEIMLHRA